MTLTQDRLNIFITSPLEPVHVERIRATCPDRIEVHYTPELLPPLRYVADHKGVDGFVRTAEQEIRWQNHLSKAHILWDFPVGQSGPDEFQLPAHVKWVQTTSSGVGQMVKNLGLQSSDLLITTARGIHARPLADFVFSALLGFYKDHRHLEIERQARRWNRYCGEGIAGKTLAVIGAGGVGRQVMAIGRAFGMTVIALARPGAKHRAEELGADALYPSDQLFEFLAEADALVLSMPHTPQTQGMISRQALAALKPGAVFINIARGQVVDEQALADALASGHIGFAALDVFETEPLPKTSPLWDLENVLISPHSASTVAQENQLITDIFCHNLSCFIDGRTRDMRNILDKTRMY